MKAREVIYIVILLSALLVLSGCAGDARDSRFDGIPLILETPEEARWPEEIALLKSFAEE